MKAETAKTVMLGLAIVIIIGLSCQHLCIKQENTVLANKLASDLRKHPETENHIGIELGAELMLGGQMSRAQETEKWIQGFN